MKLVVGNQKTYLNLEGVSHFIKEMEKVDCSEVVICPSYPYINLYQENSSFLLGAQNVSEKGNGATTGEVSAEQLSSLKVSYCIVGHSERRAEQNETSEMLLHKIKQLLSYSIHPIFCIGEHLEEKNQEITKDVIGKQILEVFDQLNKEEISQVIIAYEPIWAIGSGLTPGEDEIIDVTHYIKDLVSDKYDTSISVLYGGSVSQKNIISLNQIDAIDGYLIGGASTKPEEFLFIVGENCKR